MADVFSPEKRSEVMRAVRGTDTTPELVVRRLLHGLGYRYRLHVRGLPGSPDLVFPSRRAVVFVHGCFWHRHTCRRGRRTPATRRAYWEQKRARNQQRDRACRRALRAEGWRVCTVWECWTTPRRRDELADRLVLFLEEGRERDRDGR